MKFHYYPPGITNDDRMKEFIKRIVPSGEKNYQVLSRGKDLGMLQGDIETLPALDFSVLTQDEIRKCPLECFDHQMRVIVEDIFREDGHFFEILFRITKENPCGTKHSKSLF